MPSIQPIKSVNVAGTVHPLDKTFTLLSGITTVAGNGNSGSYKSVRWYVSGVEGVTTPYNGMKIAIKVPLAGVGTAGAVLSINGNTDAEYHPLAYNVNTVLTTHFPVNSIKVFIYDANQTMDAYLTSNTKKTITGVWKAESNYDSNTTLTYGTLAYYFRPYAAQTIYRYKFVMLDKDNRLVPLTTTNVANGTAVTNQTPTDKAFRPEKIYWYNATGTINAGAAVAGNTLVSIGYNANNSTNGGMAVCNFNSTISAYRMIYLCGNYNKSTGLFTLRDGGTASSTNYYVQVPTNTANLNLSTYFNSSYDYILLGGTYSSNTYIHLMDNNPMYYFDGTNLIPYNADTGATSIETTGTGNAVSSASYDASTRKITLTKGVTIPTFNSLNYIASISSNNTSTYKWHRLMHLNTMAGFADCESTFYYTARYQNGPHCIFRVEFRTNNTSGPSSPSIRILSGNMPTSDMAICMNYTQRSSDNVYEAYCDVFVKVPQWARAQLYRIGDTTSSNIVFYNSSEADGAASHVEAYTEINGSTAGCASYDLYQKSAYDNIGSTITQSYPASDVSSWAKASTKPTYTASEVGALPDTTKYAASSSVGGPATSAAKLTNTAKIGDTNKPVYFTANGVPEAISYTIAKSVPSDAVFTDTQSDWNVTDSTNKAFIKNKPSIPTNTNQTIKVGSITFGANDVVGLVAGTNIDSITADASAKTITINAKDTTYSSKAAASGGTDVSLVTTGEKYTWNNKQNALPTTTITGKVLKSTTTAGTVEWADDINTTYTIDSGDNNGQIKVTPSGGTAYNVDVKGLGAAAYKAVDTSVTSGSANLVTSDAVYTAINNLPEPMVFKGTLGTGGTITTLPTASTSEGYTYKVITAGTYASQSAKVGDVFVSNGSAWVLIPAGDDVEDTWRNIKVNDTELLGTGISTGAVNFKNGGNITVTGSGNNITLGVTSGYSIPSTTNQTAWSAKYDKPSGGIPDSDLASTFIKKVNNSNPDSNGNVSVTNLVPTCAVGSDSANTAGWYKIATSTLSGFGNQNILYFIKGGFSNGYSGILNLEMRSDNTSIRCWKCCWVARHPNLTEDRVIIVINGMTWTMYAYNDSNQYGRLYFTEISNRSIDGGNPTWSITYFNSNTPETTEPTATVTSSDGFIVERAKKDKDGNAIDTTYLKTSGTAANSSKLNNQEASYYLNYNNLTNKLSLAGTGSATTAAKSDHTHSTTLATSSSTATVTMAPDTAYRLTTGGTSVVFKTPSDAYKIAETLRKGSEADTADGYYKIATINHVNWNFCDFCMLVKNSYSGTTYSTIFNCSCSDSNVDLRNFKLEIISGTDISDKLAYLYTYDSSNNLIKVEVFIHATRFEHPMCYILNARPGQQLVIPTQDEFNKATPDKPNDTTMTGYATPDNRRLLNHELGVMLENTTTDKGWSMFNSDYMGYLLQSVRFNANSPAWGVGNYGAGIIFGGADTKGVISTGYGSPLIKFASGNGDKPVWWIGLTGTSGTTYNLAELKAKPSRVTGSWSVSTTNPKPMIDIILEHPDIKIYYKTYVANTRRTTIANVLYYADYTEISGAYGLTLRYISASGSLTTIGSGTIYYEYFE